MVNLGLCSQMRKHGCTLLVILLIVFHMSVSESLSDENNKKKKQVKPIRPFQPADVNELVELVIAGSKLTWKDAEMFDIPLPKGLGEEREGELLGRRVKLFWAFHRVNMTDAFEKIDQFDVEIRQHQTGNLMNKLLKAQDMNELERMMNEDVNSPDQLYRLKWLEVSSLASTFQHLYQRRRREIAPPYNRNQSAKYLQTTVNSITTASSTVYWTKASGNAQGVRAHPMLTTFPDKIDEIFNSVQKGHLFHGLRSMIDDTPNVMDFNVHESCKNGGLGNLKSVGAPHPKYVLFYLALTDIKSFIVQHWVRLYERCYLWQENPEYKAYSNATDLDDHLRKVVKQKLSWYNEAFGDFVAEGQGQGETDSGVFRCDPTRVGRSIGHVEQATYIKVTNFLKGFIAPEGSLMPSKSCRRTCSAFDGTLVSCNRTDIECLSEQDPTCAEKPELCQNFSPPCPVEDIICSNSLDVVEVCESNKRDRLLDWVVADGDSYGSVGDKDCGSKTTTMSSQWESRQGVDTRDLCEVCMCQCYSPVGENAPSVRQFSILPSVSDIMHNKVVVGIKFEQIGDQIHVLIADAKALPEGKVDMGSLKWKRPRSRPVTVQLSKRLKTVHLDDLNAPEGSVITGVRWSSGESPQPEYSQYLGLEIRVTNIDKMTGKLDVDSSRWIRHTNASRIPYTYTEPDDPMKADGHSEPDSRNGQYINFRGTSLRKDLAQTTIPFIDAQKVILDADQSAWLRGIGLFHKSRRGYGGYLSLKIMPYGTQY